MRVSSHLTTSRHHVYYFRFSIPQSLHPARLRSAIRLSLNTRCPKEALSLSRLLCYAAEQILGIDDLDLETRDFPENEIPSFFPEDIKTQIKNRMLNIKEIKAIHKVEGQADVALDIEEESTGTIKIVDLAGILIRTLERGGILLIDELEKSLHCLLLSRLVELFNDPTQNQKNAQLVFSTHTPTILDTIDFRRDQIWFTDKDDMSNTPSAENLTNGSQVCDGFIYL